MWKLEAWHCSEGWVDILGVVVGCETERIIDLKESAALSIVPGASRNHLRV